LTTAAANLYQRRAASAPVSAALKTRKAQKSSGFRARSTYGLGIKDRVLIDPACGSGNFLVVSYRELKMLELRAVKAILDTDPDRGRSLLTDWMNQYSKVSIDHFYGMELEEFPAYIARVSMWLMEHVMKQKFGALLGAVSPSLPLEAKANIACVNALTSDWTTVFPAKQLSYIIGNPPFGGALRISKSQKAEVLAIFPDVNLKVLQQAHVRLISAE